MGTLDPAFTWVARHWLAELNALVALFLAGGLLAPLLHAAGFRSAAETVYDFYLAACHEWAFRTFFLFGPRATYSREQLEAMAVDPFRFAGSDTAGWKMALCERDLAIFLGLLVFGVLYGLRWRRAGLRPASYAAYAVLIAPMALDGLTQLPGWRESTWEQRVSTGLLFGLASAWLLFPRFDASLQRRRQP